MNKTKISAKIVADSISPQGDRLISVLCTFPRIILSEVNTHRMLSKNTSSSRAIPLRKMVEAIKNDPFIPIAFQKTHTGMQGYEYLTGLDYDQAEFEWLEAKDRAIEQAEQLNEIGITKQLCNRLLEPFMWTTMLITGSKEGWDNFFNLRNSVYEVGINTFKSKKEVLDYYSDDPNFPELRSYSDLDWLQINKGQAEIHMMALAEEIYDAMNESTPMQLKAGEWHVPFAIEIINLYIKNKGYVSETKVPVDEFVKISTAMAAHTSYTIVGGEAVKSYEKWIELHDKLIAYNPPHSSPMEHCARAMDNKEYSSFIKGNLDSEIDEDGYIDISTHINNHNSFGWCNNLKGFIPYRYMIDNNLTF